MMKNTPTLILTLSLTLLLGLGGCAAVLVRTPVPANLLDQAQISHMPDIRYWGDAMPRNIARDMAIGDRQSRSMRPHLYKNNKRRQPVNFIAISGGGGDGAYGAGLLKGWSASGTRPEFDLVTGVSTGALSAPFVFLGSAYDQQLEEIYTRYSTKDLVESNIISGLLGGSAISDNSRLAKVLAKYIDRKFLKAVAREHAKGRRLLIGTTNLDAERPVVWNMGAIATVGDKQALRLFRKILIASASIPGVFPPVVINVTVNGRNMQELHVDGGTTGQVFFLPPQLLFNAMAPKNKRSHTPKLNLFIIMNTPLNARWQATEATTTQIASRSLYTLMKQQAISDLYKIYVTSKANKVNYRLASVPEDFILKSKETFDKEYMQALFEVGYQQGRNGYNWAKTPPGLTISKAR
jgi:hypothetical protein